MGPAEPKDLDLIASGRNIADQIDALTVQPIRLFARAFGQRFRTLATPPRSNNSGRISQQYQSFVRPQFVRLDFIARANQQAVAFAKRSVRSSLPAPPEVFKLNEPTTMEIVSPIGPASQSIGHSN